MSWRVMTVTEPITSLMGCSMRVAVETISSADSGCAACAVTETEATANAAPERKAFISFSPCTPAWLLMEQQACAREGALNGLHPSPTAMLVRSPVRVAIVRQAGLRALE